MTYNKLLSKVLLTEYHTPIDCKHQVNKDIKSFEEIHHII